jgi:predicted metalloprotease
MRLEDRPESDQVEDERGGGFGGRHVVGGGLGVVVVAIVLGLLTGNNPVKILQLLVSDSDSQTSAFPPATQAAGPSAGAPGSEDPDKRFVRIILGDTEDTWTQIFHERGRTYTLPKLVLFDGEVASGWGCSAAAVGPF